MKIAIIANKHRLSDELSARLASDEFTTKHGIKYDLFQVDTKDIKHVIENINHQSYHTIVIGGGDGTVRTAIETLSDFDTPIAILPIGSFNLLAKDLNYPQDIDDIFAMIKNGTTKKIDLVDINGIVSINHAWIGFYYQILKLREQHKEVIGTNRLFKIVFNVLNLFKRFSIYHLEMKIDGNIQQYKTCLVYVGNNETNLNWPHFGERKSTSAGVLSVAILKCKNRWQLFLSMISTLFGNFKNSRYVTEFTTDTLTINHKKDRIDMVIDGDLFNVNTPITFTTMPKKLTVFVPSDDGIHS